MRFLVFLFLTSFLFSASMVEELGRVRHRSSHFQRIFLKHKLNRVLHRYKTWILSSSPEEFRTNLAFSSFGRELVSRMEAGGFGRDEEFRPRYLQFVQNSIDEMKSFVETKIDKDGLSEELLSVSGRFCQDYAALLESFVDEKILLQEFHAKERVLIQSLKEKNLKEQDLRMIQILMFLEFELMEI